MKKSILTDPLDLSMDKNTNPEFGQQNKTHQDLRLPIKIERKKKIKSEVWGLMSGVLYLTSDVSARA